VNRAVFPTKKIVPNRGNYLLSASVLTD